jgi:hypothetical protein
VLTLSGANKMRSFLRLVFVCSLSAVLSHPVTVSATTLVVKVEKDRIILAADTRKMVKFQSANSDFQDGFCKIIDLGKVGFAATGHVEYNQTTPSDPVNNWSAYQDARSSYSSHPDDLLAMAEDWKARAIQFYTSFYFADMNRVKGLGAASHVLLLGLFVGWDGTGRPAMIAETIDLSPELLTLSPVVGNGVVVYERELPYATNSYTENMIDGDPALASATAKKWSTRAKKFPVSQRDWRWVEFLIQSTNAYDPAVGKDADVLEIRASGSKWLQHKACAIEQKPRRAASHK